VWTAELSAGVKEKRTFLMRLLANPGKLNTGVTTTTRQLRKNLKRGRGLSMTDHRHHAVSETRRRAAQGQPKATDTNPGTTHYEGCWQNRGHHACAVARVEEQRERAERSELCKEQADTSYRAVVADLERQLAEKPTGPTQIEMIGEVRSHLGLDNNARPESPKVVWQETIVYLDVITEESEARRERVGHLERQLAEANERVELFSTAYIEESRIAIGLKRELAEARQLLSETGYIKTLHDEGIAHTDLAVAAALEEASRSIKRGDGVVFSHVSDSALARLRELEADSRRLTLLEEYLAAYDDGKWREFTLFGNQLSQYTGDGSTLREAIDRLPAARAAREEGENG